MLGAALLLLARSTAPRGRAAALALSGAGLAAAALPLDAPAGDPATLGAWVHSWHAIVHVAGFLLAGLCAPLAIAASRRRRDIALAALLAGAAVLGGTPGWYLFLGGVLAWTELLALRASGLRPARPVAASGNIPAVRQAVRGVEP